MAVEIVTRPSLARLVARALVAWTAGWLALAGVDAQALSGSTNSQASTVSIVNPSRGAVVSVAPAPNNQYRVQIRVFDPAGISSVSKVTLSLNGGAPLPAARRSNYDTGTPKVLASVYEVLVAPPAAGGYTLVASATNSVPLTVSSEPVPITVAVASSGQIGTGDGNLLVRDNSAQLCSDCHALPSHSSEATGTKYGSWATTCRDCHAPHKTRNITLVAESILPPSVVTTQTVKRVGFVTMTGDSGAPGWSSSAAKPTSTASFANSDNSGPCQVCHTRTGGGTRWTNAGNTDAHFTAAAGTQACTTCHSHGAGFKARESEGGEDCVTCHANLYSRMKAGGNGTHYHLLASTYVNPGKPGQVYPGTSTANDVYPTAVTTTSTTDINRRCLMCHADHNVFRPDLNPANGGRGKNLRTDIAAAPQNAAPYSNFANTDFDPTAGSGICTSCHKSRLGKAYSDGAGFTGTPPATTATAVVDPAQFKVSAHNYPALTPTAGTNPVSTFGGMLTTTFSANCSKCHSDTLVKSYQVGSAYPLKFGLHNSTLTSVTDPLGVWSTYPNAPPASAALDERFCYQCHAKPTDFAGGKSTAGKDFYKTANMDASSEAIYGLVQKGLAAGGSGHKVSNYSGLHKPSPADETRSYLSANKHVACNDCHNPHMAGQTSHALGTNTVVPASGQGPLEGVSGAAPNNAATSWTAPSAYTFLDCGGSSPIAGCAQYEYQICFKCHSGANTSLASWNAGWTNVALDFNPANKSFHPVEAALNATGSGSSLLDPTQLYAGWTPGKLMMCSDCHGDDAATPAAQGPHGSAVKWILKGPYTGWGGAAGTFTLTRTPIIASTITTPPAASSLTTCTAGSGTACSPPVFCQNCHRVISATSYADNNAHQGNESLGGYFRGDHVQADCRACHLSVPHGSKTSRLTAAKGTGLTTACGNIPAPYCDSTTVSTGMSSPGTNALLQGFTKAATRSGYRSSSCAAQGCDVHGGSQSESW
jgi:hypothetical protein